MPLGPSRAAAPSQWPTETILDRSWSLWARMDQELALTTDLGEIPEVTEKSVKPVLESKRILIDRKIFGGENYNELSGGIRLPLPGITSGAQESPFPVQPQT